MMGLPLFPIFIVDFFGSALMIILSITASFHARRLVRLNPKNVLWTYLFWLCMALVAFALSRSIGHMLRFIFILLDFPHVWETLSPYSGGLNTLVFSSVAVLTFYYYNVQGVIQRVRDDANSLARANRQLEKVHAELRDLNTTLEQRVENRTRELKVSEQKFRHLYEGSKDMIFFCDAAGRISGINSSGIEMLGYEGEDELIGCPLPSLFADEEKWAKYYCRLGSQGHVKDFEVELLRRDGSNLYMMITATAIVDEANTMQGSEGIAKDLTHFKMMTDQLIQSENLASVGQLAAGVAHEINTPLGIILGYTQLLEEDFTDRPEVLETLRIVEKQTRICKRIVADLLKFSRHSLEGDKKSVDINQCIEEVLAIVEHSLNMDFIYVQRSLEDGLPDIHADPERLKQVMVNLLNNAHHAMNKEGIIGIWTHYDAHCRELEIIIGDTGPGIPPEIISRIFDPFFTTKGVGKGTGLGLSVSFGIIKDHGGHIEVFSPPRDPEIIAAGMRTAFHITLPLQPEMSTPGDQ